MQLMKPSSMSLLHDRQSYFEVLDWVLVHTGPLWVDPCPSGNPWCLALKAGPGPLTCPARGILDPAGIEEHLPPVGLRADLLLLWVEKNIPNSSYM